MASLLGCVGAFAFGYLFGYLRACWEAHVLLCEGKLRFAADEEARAGEGAR